MTTDSKHNLPVAANLLDRNFTPSRPNLVWTSDITYLWTDEGWLYLAIVLDLFNREVVGWSLKPRMTADIVTDTLTMARFRRKPASGLMLLQIVEASTPAVSSRASCRDTAWSVR